MVMLYIMNVDRGGIENKMIMIWLSLLNDDSIGDEIAASDHH